MVFHNFLQRFTETSQSSCSQKEKTTYPTSQHPTEIIAQSMGLLLGITTTGDKLLLNQWGSWKSKQGI